MTEHVSSDAQILLEAASFAARQHRKQRRKDVDATPYINHPLEVARILSEADITDLDVLIAALLHDTVEDTPTTLDDVVNAFGQRVASLVKEVTDDKSLPKAARKRQQVLTAPNKSDGAKVIKIADKIANLRDLLSGPPAWDEARTSAYVSFAKDVAKGCRGIAPSLDEMFHEAAENVVKRE